MNLINVRNKGKEKEEYMKEKKRIKEQKKIKKVQVCRTENMTYLFIC